MGLFDFLKKKNTVEPSTYTSEVKSTNIIRKARGAKITNQAQRVFLCFDPKNIADKDVIISNIHDIKYGMDCVVSWIETPNENVDKDQLREELRDTQALVLWVTAELLQSVSMGKKPIEFQIARELKRPIIPIANDGSLFPYFTELVDAIHGIAMSDPEYHEKLKKQLENFLATEELIEKIEKKAFMARIFLSYRKMDIKKAREFMKKFHNLSGFEAISIWYDNFLTAGRVFDDEIKQSILNSDAFVLLVTPNLLKKNDEGKDNYVVSTEFPFARDEGKIIVPVEAESTDSTQFAMMFDRANKAVDVENTDILSETFKTKLGNFAFVEEMDSEQAYYLGMAYLRGYGVEGDFDRAIRLLEVATKVCRESAIRAAEQLAEIYENGIGTNINYDKVFHWRYRIITISEQIREQNHPDTAIEYSNLAVAYDNYGNYSKALEWHQKTLLIRQKVLGEEHIHTAMTYNNIGRVYLSQGNFPNALEYFQKALPVFEKVHGQEHPDTAVIYNNIGTIYEKQGNYPEALEWNQKTLTIREKILGKGHPDTAQTHNNIGSVYATQNNYQKALECYQRALPVYEKAFGEEHPNTAVIYNNIGDSYRGLGDYSKALEWSQKALAISKKILGEEHSFTASVYANMGNVYLFQADYPKALKCFKKVLAIREKVLGEEHPDTAIIYGYIGLTKQNDFSEALEWMSRGFMLLLRSLGMNHPYTENAITNVKYLCTLYNVREKYFQTWLYERKKEAGMLGKW